MLHICTHALQKLSHHRAVDNNLHRNLLSSVTAAIPELCHSGGPEGLGLGLRMDEPQCIIIILRNDGPPE